MGHRRIELTRERGVPCSSADMTYKGSFFTPAADVYETPDELVIILDVPGVRPGCLEIELKENSLSIAGSAAEVESGGKPLLSEYEPGNFFRSFRLPDKVDRSGISAAMGDGVLKVVLPKIKKTAPRKITVSGE
jgi:HSP20 family protein